MQPSSGHSQYPPPPERPLHDPAGASPEAGGPGPGFAVAAPTVTIPRVRPWLTALFATLTMLLLIVGVGNQKVTDTIERHLLRSNTDTFGNRSLLSLLTYQWRFSPRGSSDFGHFWLGTVVFDVVALALTLLLVAATVRGRGFGQIFFATWTAVATATMLATYARAGVINEQLLNAGGTSKAENIFFGTYGPSASAFLAGLGFGLIVAIVAAIVGRSTRRGEVLSASPVGGYAPPLDGPLYANAPGPAAAPAPAYNREPWSAPPAPGPVASPSPWTGPGEERTVAMDTPASDSADDGPQDTAVLPAVGAPDPAEDEAGAATTQLPRAGYGEPERAAEHGTDPTTELPRTEGDPRTPE